MDGFPNWKSQSIGISQQNTVKVNLEKSRFASAYLSYTPLAK